MVNSLAGKTAYHSTGSSASVHDHYVYDMWGQPTQTIASQSADFGYAGMYYHAPSGLNLATYRAYNPTLGRWINRDPIEFKDEGNIYGYANGNPVSLTDRSGLRPLSDREKRILRHFFGDCVDNPKIDVRAADWMPEGGALSPGTGLIYFDPMAFYGGTEGGDLAMGDLAHEMMHVVQGNQGFAVLTTGGALALKDFVTNSDRYKYGPPSDDPSQNLQTFQQGTIEQQAQIMQDIVSGHYAGDSSKIIEYIKKLCKCPKGKG